MENSWRRTGSTSNLTESVEQTLREIRRFAVANGREREHERMFASHYI
jgi:hypothetical protein